MPTLTPTPSQPQHQPLSMPPAHHPVNPQQLAAQLQEMLAASEQPSSQSVTQQPISTPAAPQTPVHTPVQQPEMSSISQQHQQGLLTGVMSSVSLPDHEDRASTDGDSVKGGSSQKRSTSAAVQQQPHKTSTALENLQTALVNTLGTHGAGGSSTSAALPPTSENGPPSPGGGGVAASSTALRQLECPSSPTSNAQFTLGTPPTTSTSYPHSEHEHDFDQVAICRVYVVPLDAVIGCSL